MEEIINTDFLEELYTNARTWLITELPGLIIITIIIMVALRFSAFILKKLKKTLINRAEKTEKGDIVETQKRITTLTGIIGGTISIFLWTVFIMIVLHKFGIDIAPILASAGIVGVALGFGAQELVRDFLSGFFILLEDQVRTGDVAIINGTGGSVERIELRTITLRDFAGVVHIFQNGKINTMSNMTKEWSAMVFDIRVSYTENLEKAIEVIRAVGLEMQKDELFAESIIEPIEIFGVEELGESALIVKARIKTKPIQQWSVGREYRKRLKLAFDENDIKMPFPHTTLYWGKEIEPLELNVKKISAESSN